MKGFFLALLPGAVLLLAGCAAEGPPQWENVPVTCYDGELSRHGFVSHPIREIPTRVEDKAVQPGAILFESDSPLEMGKPLLAKGSRLAARCPFPGRPYFTVYAVRDAEGQAWIPACGVVAWPPRPGSANTWLSMISVRQPEKGGKSDGR